MSVTQNNRRQMESDSDNSMWLHLINRIKRGLQTHRSNGIKNPEQEQEPIADSEQVPEMGGACTTAACGTSNERPEVYEWEQNVLDDTVMKTGGVSHAAIVSFSDGELRAAAPRDFNPNRKVLKHIVSALKGNTADLAETGLDLGSGAKLSTPGKIDEGKAIYGTDGQGGGCTIFKSKVCALIVIYDSGPTHATRLASEVAEFMEEEGH